MSPARNQTSPDSLPSRIRDWLYDNPGAHRPAEVCDGIAPPDGVGRKRWMTRVGGELSRMALAGDLRRSSVPHESGEPGRRPVTYYSLPEANQ